MASVRKPVDKNKGGWSASQQPKKNTLSIPKAVGITPDPTGMKSMPNLAGVAPKTVYKIAGGNPAALPTTGLTQAMLEGIQKDAYDRALAAGKSGLGGGGVSAAQRNLNRYTKMLADTLRSGGFAKGFDELGGAYQGDYDTGLANLESLLSTQTSDAEKLRSALEGQYKTGKADLMRQLGISGSQAEGQIGSAMDQLSSYLKANQVNPYANFQVAGAPTGQAAITPEMRDLLATQGVSAQPLEQFAQATGQQNQAQADAFANIARIMAGTTAQANAARLADVEAQRAGALSGLAGNRAAAEYGVNQQTQDLLNELAAQDFQRRQQMGQFGLEQRLGLQNQLAERRTALAGTRANARQQYINMLMDAIAKGGRPGNLKGVM